MGRAKVSMELMTKEKSRNITFKKRKEGLIRKIHEFTTLCDVSACMIIYGPKQEKGSPEPEIWPQNPDEVRRIIQIYKAKNKDSGNKTFTLADFFHDRKKKIEEELAKLKKKNMEAKYPTWQEFLNFMPEAHLRELAAMLTYKADYVKSRIEFLKRNFYESTASGMGVNLATYYAPPVLAAAAPVLPPLYMPGLVAPPLQQQFFPWEFHEAGKEGNNTVQYQMMNERAPFFD